MIKFRAAVCLLNLLLPAASMALCSNGHIGLKQEFMRSGDVIVAKITAVEPIMDESTPDIVERYHYYGFIVRSFKGRTKGEKIDIYDDNTSSRFPMDPGDEYLLFVRHWVDGDGIDSCGNSSKIEDASQTIQDLQSYAQ